MENFRVISGVLEGYSLLQEFHVTPTEFYIPDLPKKQKTRFARKLFFYFFFFQLKYLISRHLIHSDLGENFIYWKHFPSYFSTILTIS